MMSDVEDASSSAVCWAASSRKQSWHYKLMHRLASRCVLKMSVLPPSAWCSTAKWHCRQFDVRLSLQERGASTVFAACLHTAIL